MSTRESESKSHECAACRGSGDDYRAPDLATFDHGAYVLHAGSERQGTQRIPRLSRASRG